ncbi:MAG: HAD superfamily phosphatase (TIGR01668 family) [Candidatus Marinamargulisbacteria bacterium]
MSFNPFPISEYLSILQRLLTPNDILEGVEDIPHEHLFSRGFNTMLLDVDNTILPYHQKKISLQYINWIQKIKSFGFTVFLVSNNSSHKRIKTACLQTELTGLYFAMKPFVFSAKELIEDHGLEAEKCIVVGDQLLTDVILGNWLRAHTVLVDPLGKKLSFVKTVQRETELFLLRKFGD